MSNSGILLPAGFYSVSLLRAVFPAFLLQTQLSHHSLKHTSHSASAAPQRSLRTRFLTCAFLRSLAGPYFYFVMNIFHIYDSFLPEINAKTAVNVLYVY